jgi:hypothetical protein
LVTAVDFPVSIHTQPLPANLSASENPGATGVTGNFSASPPITTFVDEYLFGCPSDESSREHVTSDVESSWRGHSQLRAVSPGLDWAAHGAGFDPQASDGGTLGCSADIEPQVGFPRSRDGGEALKLGRTETHPR